ncbi:MAG: hypothetical protein P9M03_02795, partial [Candidatus Theseobacter exili]|nr:hypothetical protein [Candidatus Theseobacter exili]
MVKQVLTIEWDGQVQKAALLRKRGKNIETFWLDDIESPHSSLTYSDNCRVIVSIPLKMFYVDEILLPFNNRTKVQNVIYEELKERFPVRDNLVQKWFSAGRSGDLYRYIALALPVDIYKKVFSSAKKYGKVLGILPDVSGLCMSWRKVHLIQSEIEALYVPYKEGGFFLIYQSDKCLDFRWISSKLEDSGFSILTLLTEY